MRLKTEREIIADLLAVKHELDLAQLTEDHPVRQKKIAEITKAVSNVKIFGMAHRHPFSTARDSVAWNPRQGYAVLCEREENGFARTWQVVSKWTHVFQSGTELIEYEKAVEEQERMRNETAAH